MVTAPVLAAACNSPLLFARRLWHETRIPVFQQSLDTRRIDQHLRESSPRVRFGESWVDDSILELFHDDVVRFRVLLGERFDEDPLAVVAAGGVPELRTLRLHNGTVYRWSRGCYGISEGVPHLRLEMRALPAGPSLLDEVASAAFAWGLLFALHERVADIRTRMSYDDVRANFQAAANTVWTLASTGSTATGWRRASCFSKSSFPRRARGLIANGVDPADASRYLDVIAARVSTNRTGAAWQLDSFAKLEGRAPRQRIMTALTAAMYEWQGRNVPVHEWAPARLPGGDRMDLASLRVEEIMSTDVYTVGPDEPIDLVGRIMDWKSVRHVPVEDAEQRVVGLLSCFDVLRFLASRDDRGDAPAASDLMNATPPTVEPGTSLSDCLQVLRDAGADRVLVTRGERLAGVVTERDFVHLLGRMVGPEVGSTD